MGIGTDELLLIAAIAFLVVGTRGLSQGVAGSGQELYGQLGGLRDDFVTALDEEEKEMRVGTSELLLILVIALVLVWRRQSSRVRQGDRDQPAGI
jgi:Sec-independent protein translocase protein TatA